MLRDLYPKPTNLPNRQNVLPTVKLEEYLRSCGRKKNNREKMAALFVQVLPFVRGGNQNLYSVGRGAWGGLLPDFFFCSLFLVQQTTSEIGHGVK